MFDLFESESRALCGFEIEQESLVLFVFQDLSEFVASFANGLTST